MMESTYISGAKTVGLWLRASDTIINDLSINMESDGIGIANIYIESIYNVILDNLQFSNCGANGCIYIDPNISSNVQYQVIGKVRAYTDQPIINSPSGYYPVILDVRKPYGTEPDIAYKTSRDIEITNSSRGIILRDRTTGTRYRLYVDNGNLNIEPV